MTTPSTTDLLKYAELQMAAEAFLVDAKGIVRTDLDVALVDGNKHVSKFTETEATNFLAHWKVVAQQANTNSGFSGTLFECILDDPITGAKAGEKVISFRSTEFIDDAARDNQATNTLEIADHGLAFGQIADMETWYAKLKQNGKITDPTQLSVTGYSLGGHLATAFNLLRTEENPPITLNKVVTFNGAGMGTWDTPTLSAVINRFNGLRNVADGESAAAHVEITDSHQAERKRPSNSMSSRAFFDSGEGVVHIIGASPPISPPRLLAQQLTASGGPFPGSAMSTSAGMPKPL